jgi:arylsulfatase A-like enzyme
VNLNRVLFYKNMFLKRFLFIFLPILFFAGMQVENNLFSSEEKENLSSKYRDYNVVLIILDALRPDYLGCYGYSKKVSPNIDRLSNKSVIFNNAFCQFPVTFPSTTSIFTSLYPSSHGAIEIFKDTVPERVYTMAQILSIYGYNTAWFGGREDPHTGGAKVHLLKGYNDIKEINNADIFRWIEENKTKPFFLTIHSYSTHNGSFPFQRFNNDFSRKVPKEFYELFNGIEEKQWYIFQETLNNKPDEIYKALGREWVEKHRADFLKPYSEENINKLCAESEDPERFFKLSRFLRVNSRNCFPIVCFYWIVLSSK